MRNGQNKRMRGRNRNHKGHHGGGGGGGGGGHHNPLTRVYESNGPEVKIRGTAHHIAEKYLQLARDAQSSGDPVTAENHFQHAEHYLRLIAAAQEQFRQQNPYYQAPPAPGEGNRDDVFDSDGDGDDEDGNQPMQNQNQQNYGGSQNFNNQQNSGGSQNFDNQQPPYPPREQPYGGQQPSNQGRQNYQPQPHQQQQQPQFQPQPQPQPVSVQASDGERLPSFITGAQPQPSSQGFAPNGDDNSGGDFPRHRRRRHRSAGPRPDMANGPQGIRGEGSDVPGGNN
jgi:hypothetical protein